MVHQYRPNFPHRLNADYTYDSICTLCHLTVATAKIETKLSQHEQSHECSPARLYELNEYRFESSAIAIGQPYTSHDTGARTGLGRTAEIW
jgi:hypothetical protein